MKYNRRSVLLLALALLLVLLVCLFALSARSTPDDSAPGQNPDKTRLRA